MTGARCGQQADMAGFRTAAGVMTNATEPEFQALCTALAAVADRFDAERVLEQALAAVGWEADQ